MDKDPKAEPAANDEPAGGASGFKQTYLAEHGDSPATRAVLGIFEDIGRKVRNTAELERVLPSTLSSDDFIDPDEDGGNCSPDYA